MPDDCVVFIYHQSFPIRWPLLNCIVPAKGGTPNATLADLYDPLATPPALQQAHEVLDRAVDKCYRPEPFTSERQRVEFLFSLYEKLTAPLLPATSKTRGRKAKGLYSQPPPPLPPGQTTPESEAAAAVFHNIMGKEEGPEYRTN